MDYEKLMKRCIKLAKQAEGKVSPNPLVGCVVLNSRGIIISKGYHEQYGACHAERAALLKLDEDAARGGTMFVNLEPCAHYGKTPPCTDLIIERGIKRVIIGMKDPNPIVCGKGIQQLQQAGIEVTVGLLEEDCRNLNEVFVKDITKHEIFVAIKTATTLDGKIATQSGSSKWITSEKARQEVLKIRNRYDCIMTSSATVLADNPTMAHRVKVVLDRNLKTDFKNAKIYKEGKIFVYYDQNLQQPADKYPPNLTFVPCPTENGRLELKFVLKDLYEKGLKSVLIESGGHLNGTALKFCDKIYQFVAPKILGDNSAKSCYDYRHVEEISETENFKFLAVKKFSPDILFILKRADQ